MTREEQIKQWSKDYRKYREICGVTDPICLDEIEEAYYLGARECETHPGWISVNDKLPPRDEDHPAESIPVLVYNPTSKDKVGLDWYVYDDVDFIGWYSLDEGITHWMPLPSIETIIN